MEHGLQDKEAVGRRFKHSYLEKATAAGWLPVFRGHDARAATSVPEGRRAYPVQGAEDDWAR